MAKFKLFGGTNPAATAATDAVAVIGLGRFGQALALELMSNGTEVLGIDHREEVVQGLNTRLTHAVRADATSEETLKQLGIPDFGHVVVAIGSHIEASILITSLLLRFRIGTIWAKAVSDAHGTILEQLGVEHVVYPEKDMGRRVAHLVRGHLQDYVEIESDYAMVKTSPPASMLGRTLGEADIRKRHHVTVIARRPRGGDWEDATPSTTLNEGDVVLVTGQARRVEAFARLT